MNAEQLKLMAADPAEFRRLLGLPAPNLADFQVRDFEHLDVAFKALAAGTMPPVRRLWLERTKGASKDSDLASLILWLLAFSPRPLTIQVGAADQDQADELRRAAAGMVRQHHKVFKRLGVDVQADAILSHRSGGRADIIPADVAGSHGARPDLLILNELTHVTKQDFALNLLDNASKVLHGVVVVATNAGFCPSWQWDYRESVRTSPRGYFSTHDQPAPWLDVREIAEAERRNPPNRFLRLWRGIWTTGSGDALAAEDIKAAICLQGPTLVRDRNATYYAGIDLGISRDHSAVVLVAKDNRTKRLSLSQVLNWKPPAGGKVDLDVVLDKAMELHREFRPVFYLDPYQGELLATQMKKRGAMVELIPFTGKVLPELATAVIETFSSRSIDIYRHEGLIADLHSLRLKESAQGWKLDAARTQSGHADRATALALALLASRRLNWGARLRFWIDGRPVHEPDPKSDKKPVPWRQRYEQTPGWQAVAGNCIPRTH
jgi:hypothetical protein